MAKQKEKSWWMVQAKKPDNSRSRQFVVPGMSVFDASFEATTQLREKMNEVDASDWSVEVTDLDEWRTAHNC